MFILLTSKHTQESRIINQNIKENNNNPSKLFPFQSSNNFSVRLPVWSNQWTDKSIESL